MAIKKAQPATTLVPNLSLPGDLLAVPKPVCGPSQHLVPQVSRGGQEPQLRQAPGVMERCAGVRTCFWEPLPVEAQRRSLSRTSGKVSRKTWGCFLWALTSARRRPGTVTPHGVTRGACMWTAQDVQGVDGAERQVGLKRRAISMPH